MSLRRCLGAALVALPFAVLAVFSLAKIGVAGTVFIFGATIGLTCIIGAGVTLLLEDQAEDQM